MQQTTSDEMRDWSRTIFVLTRMAWLRRGHGAVRALLSVRETEAVMLACAKAFCHPFVQSHVYFLIEALGIQKLEGDAKEEALFRLHKRKNQNPMFYCTKNEITYGTLKSKGFRWNDILTEIEDSMETSAMLLAEHLMPQLLDTSFGIALVQVARDVDSKLPSAGKTVAAGTVSPEEKGDSYFLELFANAIVDVENVAIATLDASTKTILSTNERGFQSVTGRADAIGRDFLSLFSMPTRDEIKDNDTVADTINAVLASSEPKAFKQTQYKADGSPFQCLVAVRSVFNDQGDKKFLIVSCLDMDAAVNSKNCERFISEMEAVMANVPATIACDGSVDLKCRQLIPNSTYRDAAGRLLAKAVAKSLLSKNATTEDADIPLPSTKSLETMVGANPTFFPGMYKDVERDITISHKREDVSTISYKSAASKASWLGKAETVLEALLKSPEGRDVFAQFLESEKNKPALDFYVAAVELQEEVEKSGLKADDAENRAKTLVKEYNVKLAQAKIVKDSPLDKEEIGSVCGLALDSRTPETAVVWSKMYDDAHVMFEKGTVYENVLRDSRNTLRMLAVDAFPRFLLSNSASKLGQGVNDPLAKSVAEEFASAGASLLPKTVDHWLYALIATIASWPACIVVADMTISGAPMVYVNPKFSETTGYSFDEAVGRNCRFLQGKNTEAMSKEIISRTLSEARDCHVLITNYKKSGEQFTNLLTMRPIFDADGVYRYCVGVQFELTDECTLPTQLGRLDKFLQLLPRQLPFQGIPPRAEHLPDYWLDTEDQAIENPLPDQSPGRIRPDPTSPARPKSTEHLSFDKTASSKATQSNPTSTEEMPQRFAFSRIKWLLEPEDTVESIVRDDQAIKRFADYLKDHSGPVAAYALTFVKMANAVLALKNDESQQALLVKLYARMKENLLCGCTITETQLDGAMSSADWIVVKESLIGWRNAWTSHLARTYLRPFMNSTHGAKLFLALRQRELVAGSNQQNTTNNEAMALKTVQGDKKRTQSLESLYLDMLHTSTNRLSDVGLTVSDMRVPGLPLIYINAGFLKATGYGREQIGLPCSFLQGKKTEPYIVDEIVDALRHASPFFCKLSNYTNDEELFQCMFTLSPVFDSSNKYVFQVATQLNFTAKRTKEQLVASLCAMADITRFLPVHVSGLKKD